MNNKSRSGLMVIASGYLVYLGIKLIADVVRGETGGTIVFALIGLAFLILGGLFAFINIKGLIAARKEEAARLEEEEEVVEDLTDEAAGQPEAKAGEEEEEQEMV